jgi:hypothetical protein
MVFSVPNVVGDRTCKVGWVASGPTKGRMKLVDLSNIEWLDKIHTADSMYPTSRNVQHLSCAFLVQESVFRSQCGRRPSSASSTPTRKQVCHISPS